MNRISVSLLITIILILIFNACYYDNEEALYPSLNTTCDTLNVSYSGAVTHVLLNNCYSCHSDATAAFGGGIHLQSLTDVRTYSTKIQGAIHGTTKNPMPPVGKLDACSIVTFDIWIKNGLPEN